MLDTTYEKRYHTYFDFEVLTRYTDVDRCCQNVVPMITVDNSLAGMFLS